jgi:hypothetical protein
MTDEEFVAAMRAAYSLPEPEPITRPITLARAEQLIPVLRKARAIGDLLAIATLETALGVRG